LLLCPVRFAGLHFLNIAILWRARGPEPRAVRLGPPAFSVGLAGSLVFLRVA